MAKRAKRRRSRSAEEKPRAERTNAGRGPEWPPQDLILLAWLLAPERIETLRRQLIDGTAGSIEPLLHKVAYSGPLDPEGRRLRFVRSAQFWAEMGGEAPRDPPQAEERKPSPAPDEPSESAAQYHAGYRIKWDKVVLDVRRRARALVEEPGYQESLRRRLPDGKAPAMMRLLWQWPDRKSRDPYQRGRGNRRLSFVMDHLPGEWDPLTAQEKKAIAAQEAQEAREARAKLVATTTAPSDEPADPEALELVRLPELL